MTSGQIFALCLLALSTTLAIIGYFFKRTIGRNDQRWAILSKLVDSDTADAALKPEWERRMIRSEQAIDKLLSIVTELGLQFARHEGWHDRYPQPDDPKMG